jgi:hypothetical protein
VSKIYRATITKSIEQDEFNEGCIPKTYQDLGEVYILKSKDLNLVTEKVQEFLKLYDLKFHEIYDNKLEVSRLETDDGDAPSQHCVDAWKKGPKELKKFSTKMWNASYTVILETVETTEINAGQLLDKKAGAK